jgi:hypothetical protein
MKKVLAFVALAILLVAVCLLLRQKSAAPLSPVAPPVAVAAPDTVIATNPNPPAQIGPDVAAALAVASNRAVHATMTTRGVMPAPAPPPGPSPLTILDNARVAIHSYNGRFGENPVGDNAEITAALMGNNPKQVNFVTPESGLRVNEKGEMIDAWGTPFFFHQLSGQITEIRSAGEDKIMWTLDDQVTR